MEIVAVDDKRQITAVFAASLTGDLLPPQLIYKSTTKRCLPTIKFPATIKFPSLQPQPLVQRDRNEGLPSMRFSFLMSAESKKSYMLKLHEDCPALVIFHKFTGQGTESLLKLQDNHIHFVMVPVNCTDRLQPLDVSVNKPAKSFLRQQFHGRYAKKSANSSKRRWISLQLTCD